MSGATPLKQLYPVQRDLDPWRAYGNLRLSELARQERPYVVANMVSSVDGDATRDGRAKGVSSELDREMFHVLRTQTDAILVGPNTIRIENYGPMVKDPRRREQRETIGLAAEPIAVTVSRSMDLPVDAPLVNDAACRLIVITGCDLPLPPQARGVDLIRTPGDEVDFERGLAELRQAHGIGTVLCEGGPTLLGSLIEAGVVDELFLTISPTIGGGSGGPTIVEGPRLSASVATSIVSVLTGAQSLFLRMTLERR